MGLQINWFSSIIEVTSPTTSVDMQTLHDFIEDQMATPVGFQHDDIIQPEGKIEDASNPGIFSQIIIVLNSPWQIQFWPGSGYTRIYGGKLVGGLSDQPFKATGTAGDITVLESPVDGVTSVVATGSAVTEQDKTDIITGVHAHTIEGAMTSEKMMRLLFAVSCGAAYDADTHGPITPNTARIEYMGADGVTARIISTADLYKLGGRDSVAWNPN